MTLAPAELQRRFEAAQRLLAARRAPEARAMLAPVRDAAPRDPAVRRLMAQALVDSGDLKGAEAELRAALAALPPGAKGAAPLAMQLGVLLAHAGRHADAEASLRQAVSLDRRFPPATAALAEHLVAQGRAEEAVSLLEPLARVRDFALASALGDTLKVVGRKAEAAEHHRRAAAIEPQNAVAWHNLAATVGDLQRFAEAEAATARARALGLDAPETWLVRARALAGLERWDESEAAYREAIRRRPLYAAAHRGLAQQVWMRTGDLAAAVRDLDAALAARPDAQALTIELAQLQAYADAPQAADRTLAAAAERPDAQPLLRGAASQKAVRFDPDRAARYAEAAVASAPGDDDLRRTLAEARMAQGRWEDALALAEDLLTRSPDNQQDLMLQSTCWRLGGDPRRLARDDYDALVRARSIDAPPGWPDLPAYLRDLAAGLERLHVTRTHPVGQSLRGGTQTNANLLESDDPAVRAFPQAVDGAIKAYMAALGPGDDPVRRRNTGAHRFAGVWSVRLRAEGRHVDHIHPAGWLSSACYIAVPPAVEAGGREGWIKFGEPGAPTKPKLEAERFVKPEPGLLVLFPSYMWHGTVPFSGDHPRLTVAFDLLPD